MPIKRLILPLFFSVSIFCHAALAQRPSSRPAPAPKLTPGLPTLWIVGDSTVRNGQDTGNNGQWGWGNPIASFFDRSQINVENYALGGTSSRTFQTIGRWGQVLSWMKPGDYVILQFGHNDGGSLDDPARARGTIPGNGPETRPIDNPITQKHEVVHSYGWYLRSYVSDAKAKGATDVIICSLIPRNHWKDGKVDSTSKYPQWAAAAAKEVDAPFIDLHSIIAAKYEALGEQTVTDTYFPVKETTHTDWAGAIFNAQCVVEGIKSLDKCDLKKYLLPTPPLEADIKLPSGKAR